MGFKQVRTSDISGAEVENDEVVTVIVRRHPSIEEPKQFDALPSEVADLKSADNLVALEIKNGVHTTEMVVTLAAFNKLAPNIEAVLTNADPLRGRRKGFRPSSGE